jgi:agmatinase
LDAQRLKEISNKVFKDFISRRPARILQGDTPTFMQLPRAKRPADLKDVNVVFLGIPYEGVKSYSPEIIYPAEAGDAPREAIYFRTGVADAPEWVRKWSVQHSILHYDGKGYFVERDINLMDYLTMVDYGDVDCLAGDTMTSLGRAKTKIEEIVAAGAIPLVIGGDHSVPIPALLAIGAATDKKVGIIGFDTHFDLMGLGDAEGDELWNPAAQYTTALKLPNFEPENIVLIGMKGIRNPRLAAEFAKELGITYFTMRDIDEQGIASVVNKAVKRATTGTEYLYVTLDIDVMDSSMCPGTRFPDTPGLTPREIIQALRIIGDHAVISGFDISCLSPRYDSGGSTQYLAARCYLEVMASLAAQFRDRAIDKWFQI